LVERARWGSFGQSDKKECGWSNEPVRDRSDRAKKDSMTGAEVLDISREGIWVMIIVAAPMMIVGLVVGVVIALFQALTQIQEQTLVFVPKIIAIFVVMLLALPFMGATMANYMTRVADMIVTGG